MKKITAKRTMFSDMYGDSRSDYFLINTPSICSHCGLAISPKILSSRYIVIEELESYAKLTPKYDYRIFVEFICGNCLHTLIAEYSYCHPLDEYESYTLNPDTVYPIHHSKPNHSAAIGELSKKFVEIYDQSYFAEESNLNEICGMGYRKALEFLIKDYAIKLHPNDEEEIKKSMLSSCINKYIDNRRIKNLAIASAWIGNDETHYCRKHEDYNLESLKSFINAVESFITSEMEVIKAEELLNSSH